MHAHPHIESSRALAAWLAVPVENTADFDLIARAIASLLVAPVVLISTLERGRHQFVGSHGVSPDAADDVSPLCLEVVTLERQVLMQDARRHLALDARDELGVVLTSFMGLPIIGRDGTCFGAVSVLREQDHCWHGRDLVVLRSFVALLADLFAERRDRRQSPYARHPSLATAGPQNGLFMLSAGHEPRPIELRALGMRDPLTGLLDDRGFMLLAQRALDTARVEERPVWLVCVAVDSARDLHACSIADVLRRYFGDADVIARLESDLFIVAITDVADRDIAAITDALAVELGRMPTWTWTVSLIPDDCESRSTTAASLSDELVRRMRLAQDIPKD